MKLVLREKAKITQFTTIFQLVKACSETVCVIFTKKYVHIQIMDKSHICLCDCCLYYEWFDNENMEELKQQVLSTIQNNNTDNNINNNSFIFSSNIFHTIIHSITEQMLVIEFEAKKDTFQVSLLYDTATKENIHKYYSLPLIELEQEIMNIPDDTEYNVEFTIGAKTISDIFNQMSIFSSSINIKCDEDNMKVSSLEGSHGTMSINVNTDDFEEFSIDENFELDIDYSLTHIMKYCLTTKLNPMIQFYISTDAPMKINYFLNDKATVRFFIAAKISE